MSSFILEISQRVLRSQFASIRDRRRILIKKSTPLRFVASTTRSSRRSVHFVLRRMQASRRRNVMLARRGKQGLSRTGSLTPRNIVTVMSAARRVSFLPLIRRPIVLPFDRDCRDNYPARSRYFDRRWQLLSLASNWSAMTAWRNLCDGKYSGGTGRKLISLRRGRVSSARYKMHCRDLRNHCTLRALQRNRHVGKLQSMLFLDRLILEDNIHGNSVA